MGSEDRGAGADLDCGDCGACCTGESERYVPVRGDDHARMGRAAAEWTRFIGNRCYMRMDAGRCAALAVIDGRWRCQIYEIRPETCRTLELGSDACDAERFRKLSAMSARRP